MGAGTWSPTSKWVVEGGGSYLHAYVDATITGLVAKGNAPDFNPHLPYTNFSPKIASITINSTSYKANGPITRENDNTQGFVNVTHVMGRHTLLLGANVERFRTIYATLGSTNGTFTFKAPASTGNSQAIFNQSFADFLTSLCHKLFTDECRRP